MNLPLVRVVMRSVRSTVERRFESYSGSLFSAAYVVVAEQAHPLHCKNMMVILTEDVLTQLHK